MNIELAEYLSGLQPCPLSPSVLIRLRKYPLPLTCGAALQLVGASIDTCCGVDRAVAEYFQSCQTRHHQLGSASSLPCPPISRDVNGEVSSTATEQPDANATVPQLRSTCVALGLLSSGTKDTLIDRLLRFRQQSRETTSCVGTQLPPTSSKTDAPKDVARKISPSDYFSRTLRSASDKDPREDAVPKIVLYADKRERIMGTHDTFIDVCRSHGSTEVESRTLPCGDFAFATEATNGIVYLPVLLERKKLTDLLSSVTSPRWGTQKDMMLRSPFAIPVVVVEGSAAERSRLRPDEVSRIDTALCTCGFVDGLVTVRTQSADESAMLLHSVADMCKNLWRHRNLRSRPCVSGGMEVPAVVVDSLLGNLREALQRHAMPLRMLSLCAGVSTPFARRLFAAMAGLWRASQPALVGNFLAHQGTGVSLFDIFRFCCAVASLHEHSHDDHETSNALRKTLAGLSQTLLSSKAHKSTFALLVQFLSMPRYAA